jgi:hypothetical protein
MLDDFRISEKQTVPRALIQDTVIPVENPLACGEAE